MIQWMEACMPGKDGASNLANVKAYQSMDPGMMVISHDSQLNWFFSITGSDTLHPNSPWICPEANSSFLCLWISNCRNSACSHAAKGTPSTSRQEARIQDSAFASI